MQSQFSSLVKLSIHMLSYDMCQTRHPHHLTLLLTDLLKLPPTSSKVAYSENSYSLCKLLSLKEKKKKEKAQLKCHGVVFSDTAGPLIQSSLQLQQQVGAQSLAFSQSVSGVKPMMPLFREKLLSRQTALSKPFRRNAFFRCYCSPHSCRFPLSAKLDVETVSK